MNDRIHASAPSASAVVVEPADEPVRILGIAGSLRRQSYNRAALRAAAELLPPGSSLEFASLDGIPIFNQDAEHDAPQAVVSLRNAIRAADALLIVTPEYNYSVPGVLKNAIDWASRPRGENAFAGKTAAVMGASVGALGTARAQYHLRQMFVFLDVHAVNQPEVMIGNAAERFDAEGHLVDPRARTLIAELIKKLVAFTRVRRRGGAI